MQDPQGLGQEGRKLGAQHLGEVCVLRPRVTVMIPNLTVSHRAFGVPRFLTQVILGDFQISFENSYFLSWLLGNTNPNISEKPGENDIMELSDSPTILDGSKW